MSDNTNLAMSDIFLVFWRFLYYDCGKVLLMQTTLTTKGQATIPKGVRDHLNLKPGDKVEFVLSETGEVVLKSRGHNLLDLFGMLKGKGVNKKALTVEQMHEEVSEGVNQKFKKAAAGQ